MIERLKRELAQVSLISWLWFILALVAVFIVAHDLRYEPTNEGAGMVWDRWGQKFCRAEVTGLGVGFPRYECE